MKNYHSELNKVADKGNNVQPSSGKETEVLKKFLKGQLTLSEASTLNRESFHKRLSSYSNKKSP